MIAVVGLLALPPARLSTRQISHHPHPQLGRFHFFVKAPGPGKERFRPVRLPENAVPFFGH
jgi:hypothetical protein